MNIIDISSIAFLAIAITMFEIGYRKDKVQIFINGIELFALATMTLLIKHIPKILGCTIKNYIIVVIFVFITYYILKIAIMYTKSKYDKLKSLSDIKEIVKEEPLKKVAKRKNKKVEEGK